MPIHQKFLKAAIKSFHSYKLLAETAFEQLSEDDFHYALDKESNSVAILIQHLSGNMKSRFTDFLTSDGEKPDRFRDQEFENKHLSKAELLQLWQEGWQIVFNAVESLNEEDMDKNVTVRQEELSVMDAIIRQITHYAYHTGQIIFIAKHIRQSQW